VPTYHHDTYAAIDPTKTDLSGKTVLITGASKGIGAATALSFARAGASGIIIGARSSLSDLERDIAAAAKQANRPVPKILALHLDVSSQESVEAAASAAQKEFSSIDILINNAGYLETWRPVHDSAPGEWWKTWSVNIFGTYLACRSFLPLLLKSDLKTVVNISSVGAHRAAPGASAYQTSKLAVIRFTEFLMAEYGEEGLIAMSAHPGGVSTELARNMPQDMHQFLKDTPQLAGDFFVKLTSERRGWLAGRYVSVNWDFEELEGKREEIVDKDLLKVRLAL
jgi:NAD(P)-dependent dehydrogenase (short-subunit alcohol dehydrogenase family)